MKKNECMIKMQKIAASYSNLVAKGILNAEKADKSLTVALNKLLVAFAIDNPFHDHDVCDLKCYKRELEDNFYEKLSPKQQKVLEVIYCNRIKKAKKPNTLKVACIALLISIAVLAILVCVAVPVKAANNPVEAVNSEIGIVGEVNSVPMLGADNNGLYATIVKVIACQYDQTCSYGPAQALLVNANGITYDVMWPDGDICIGDYYAVLMDNNDTPEVCDDIIIDVKYERIDLLESITSSTQTSYADQKANNQCNIQWIQ